MQAKKQLYNRREFVKTIALGGTAFLYGCSKQTTAPSNDEPPPPPPEPQPPTRIALYKTQNRTEGVKKVLELLDVDPMQGKKVLLKPNFNTSDPAPASTHNDTLSQLVKEIWDRGASQITLAERSYQSFQDVISQKGVDELALKLGFDIVPLENQPMTRFTRAGIHWSNGFDFPDILRDAEYIVSTCCLKTHQYGGVFTMSLKLSVGCLPSKHMNELHQSSYMRKCIAEINLAYKPNLIVMDGIKAFISGGPSSGTERLGEVMVAGTDRIAVDAVGVAILKHLGSTQVPGKIFEQEQIKRAVELKLGIQEPDQIEFVTPDEASKQYTDTLKSILENG